MPMKEIKKLDMACSVNDIIETWNGIQSSYDGITGPMITGQEACLKGCGMDGTQADLTCVMHGLVIALLRDGCKPADLMAMFKLTTASPYLALDKKGEHIKAYQECCDAMVAWIKGLIAVPGKCGELTAGCEKIATDCEKCAANIKDELSASIENPFELAKSCKQVVDVVKDLKANVTCLNKSLAEFKEGCTKFIDTCGTMKKCFEKEENMKEFCDAAKKCEKDGKRGMKECYENTYGKLKVKAAVAESSGCCAII